MCVCMCICAQKKWKYRNTVHIIYKSFYVHNIVVIHSFCLFRHKGRLSSVVPLHFTSLNDTDMPATHTLSVNNNIAVF